MPSCKSGWKHETKKEPILLRPNMSLLTNSKTYKIVGLNNKINGKT
jgi:hypothetical protein